MSGGLSLWPWNYLPNCSERPTLLRVLTKKPRIYSIRRSEKSSNNSFFFQSKKTPSERSPRRRILPINIFIISCAPFLIGIPRNFLKKGKTNPIMLFCFRVSTNRSTKQTMNCRNFSSFLLEDCWSPFWSTFTTKKGFRVWRRSFFSLWILLTPT